MLLKKARASALAVLLLVIADCAAVYGLFRLYILRLQTGSEATQQTAESISRIESTAPLFLLALLAVEFALWLAIVRFRNRTADTAEDFLAQQEIEMKSAPDWYTLHAEREQPARRIPAKSLFKPLLRVLLPGAAGFAAIYLIFHPLFNLLFPSGGELLSFLRGLEILLYLGWLAFIRSLSIRVSNEIQPPKDPG